MDEAVNLSLKHMELGQGGPFGCVIVKDGAIVGRGWNNVLASNDPTAHAEVSAIRDACKNLETYQLTGCDVYTSCEPCPMCMSAIYWAMMDGVYFANSKEQSALAGFDDSKIYNELKLSWKARAVSMVHAPNETAEEAFRVWEQLKKDKL